MGLIDSFFKDFIQNFNLEKLINNSRLNQLFEVMFGS